MSVKALEWSGDKLMLLDQRLLPGREVWLELKDWRAVEEAICDMAVRGAPAIGIAGAYGLALAARAGEDLGEAYRGLAATRPTAVNLFWALDRMMALPEHTPSAFLAEAQKIEREDFEMNLAIGKNGAALIQDGWNVLTICNTGSLATGGHGTALGIIRSAFAQGKRIHVYACETRPRQQGLRLTTWELLEDGIPFHAIADGAAGSLMQSGKVQAVVAGADRVAANGDTANKIGTYALAVQAHYHQIPFYIAAPSSTLDPGLSDSSQIPIEERVAEELTCIEGVKVAPEGCPVYNPAFDITPARLISAIITEHGVQTPPYSFARERVTLGT